MKKFTKDDLQVNDIVTARDGERYMIYKISGGLVGVSSNDCFCVGKGADFWHDDMMKVQRPVYPHQLQTRSWDAAPVIWKRKEKEKAPLLSEAEYHILNNANAQWKWIARDKDKCLVLYRTKPYKKSVFWCNGDIVMTTLDMYNHLFSHIKWGDDKPWEIAKLLERYEEERNHGN